jgi:hypothetical protein
VRRTERHAWSFGLLIPQSRDRLRTCSNIAPRTTLARPVLAACLSAYRTMANRSALCAVLAVTGVTGPVGLTAVKPFIPPYRIFAVDARSGHGRAPVSRCPVLRGGIAELTLLSQAAQRSYELLFRSSDARKSSMRLTPRTRSASGHIPQHRSYPARCESTNSLDYRDPEGRIDKSSRLMPQGV